MAAPNMLLISTITGKTAGVSLTTTNATSIVSNAASSNKVFKINVLNISNTNTTTAVDVTVSYYSGAALSGTAYPILANVTVPAKSTLTVIDNSSRYYLEENTSIGVTAATSNYAVVTVSYEELS